METDDVELLWFENFSGKPCVVRSREELLIVETEPIKWQDANVCSSFELLLPAWKQRRSMRASAFARSTSHPQLPLIALGSHQGNGPRVWIKIASDLPQQRHLKRVFPALLRRRLWERVLWLDRELNFLSNAEGEIAEELLWNGRAILRLYLGANGQAEWFQPTDPRHFSLWTDFTWGTENEVSRLLESSDEELRAHIVELARQEASDTAFSLRWTLWDWNSEAWQRRRLLTLRTERDSIEAMCDFLGWALACEPELRDVESLSWLVAPLRRAAEFYGPPECWRDPLGLEVPYPDERLHLRYQSGELRLPPFLRRLRDWAGYYFGASLDEALIARHPCVGHGFAGPQFDIKREETPTAHEQIETFAQLRDFLAERVAPDELAALLKLA